MVDVAVSEASRLKAAAAKSYIENMYRVHAQKHQDRRDRCNKCLAHAPVVVPHTTFHVYSLCSCLGGSLPAPWELCLPTAVRQTDHIPQDDSNSSAMGVCSHPHPTHES